MKAWMTGFLGLTLLVGSGCAVILAKRSPWDIQRLEELSNELEQFKTLAQMKAAEADELRQAKAELEKHLSSSEAKVGYDERGLVTRFLDGVLFDSGKAQVRRSAYPVLDKVAGVLKDVPDQPVGIEGHTDNEPIKHSGWADNTELSIARANAVLEYLTKNHGLDLTRLTVIGYGETRPIASNDTREGRQKNRRVEIVILPQASEKSYEAEAKRVLRHHSSGKK